MPNPIDVHVGARIRVRRSLLGLSQESLGEAIGLTFQQIQKYEQGANRIGAGRLYRFSRILGVPVQYFFDDLPSGLESVEGQVAQGLRDTKRKPAPRDPLTKRETLELVRAYYRISDPSIRRTLCDLVKACADRGEA